MATKLVLHVVPGAPSTVDIPTAVLAAVRTVYPTAAAAYPYGELTSISPSQDGGGKTVLEVKVVYPTDRPY